MKLSENDLKTLCANAIKAAETAGKMVAETRPKDICQDKDGDNLATQMLTEVDGQCQEMILRILEPSFAPFDLALLAEESPDDGSRLDKDYFWCIDPIDGTLPFVEGIPGYAVSIALVSKEGEAVIGVVYDPVKHTLYHAIKGQGAFRNFTPWQLCDHGSRLQIFTDRSIAALPYCKEMVRTLDADVTGQAGAVMNALWCLENPPACYFKFPKEEAGGGSFWDYAATACIYAEAGAVASDINGAPLLFNRADSTYMNHCGILYATDKDIADQVIGLRARLDQ